MRVQYIPVVYAHTKGTHVADSDRRRKQELASMFDALHQIGEAAKGLIPEDHVFETDSIGALFDAVGCVLLSMVEYHYNGHDELIHNLHEIVHATDIALENGTGVDKVVAGYHIASHNMAVGGVIITADMDTTDISAEDIRRVITNALGSVSAGEGELTPEMADWVAVMMRAKGGHGHD
jgi:hypothetical protein